MIGLIIFVHVIICVLLVTIILIQRGRGGGLVETFSDMESMFGTKTNAFLTRATSILSTLFFITCLSLALISARQAKSLMPDVKEGAPLVSQEQKATLPAQEKKEGQIQENLNLEEAPAQTQKAHQEAPKAEEK